MKIVLTVYNCAPLMGSEHAMGWNIVTRLAKLHSITVITREEFKASILQCATGMPQLTFVFIKERSYAPIWPSIPPMLDFYLNYRKWEFDAYKAAKKINDITPVDILHKLNIIGIKEPGYLFRITGPKFILGPIGGFEYLDLKYFPYLKPRAKLFALINNLSVFKSRFFSPRIAKALKQASFVYVINNLHKNFIKSRFRQEASGIMPDSATLERPVTLRRRQPDDVFKIIVSCRLEAVKGIQVTVAALSRMSKTLNYEFIIIGDGAFRAELQNLCVQKRIPHRFLGWLDRDTLFGQLEQAHVFVYTSFKDANTHILPEAVSSGCPVVCINHLGYGDFLSNDIAIKVYAAQPVRGIISDVSAALFQLCTNEDLRFQMATNCLEFSRNNSWDKMTENYMAQYRLLTPEAV